MRKSIIIFFIIFSIFFTFFSLNASCDYSEASVIVDYAFRLLQSFIEGEAVGALAGRESEIGLWEEFDRETQKLNDRMEQLTLEAFVDNNTSVVDTGFSHNSGRFYELVNSSGDHAFIFSSDIDAAYNSYVSSLGSTTISSGSSLSFNLLIPSSFISDANTAVTNGWISNFCVGSGSISYKLGKHHVFASGVGAGNIWEWWKSSSPYSYSCYTSSFLVPSGSYSFPYLEWSGQGIYGGALTLQVYNDSSWKTVRSYNPGYISNSSNGDTFYSSKSGVSSAVNLIDGNTYRFIFSFDVTGPQSNSNSGGSTGTYIGFPRNFSFSPSVLLTLVSSSPSISSSDRPTTVNLRPVGYDGDIAGLSIVNEANNTFTDPRTMFQYEIDNWTYDYTTRTYTINTTSGKTFQVVYGNDSVNVHEVEQGGNSSYPLTNNFYYIYNYGSGSGSGSSGHVHNWTSTTIAPTCTMFGMVVQHCSDCGADQIAQYYPALDHNWQLVQTVQPVYDQEGQLETEGYELYRCSRCSEEKTVALSSPQTNSDVQSFKFWSWLQNWLKEFKIWLGDKLDALIGKETNIDVNVTDNSVTIVDENGEEQEINIPDIISRFGWFRQVWAIGTYFVDTVSGYEQAAYSYGELMEEGGNPPGAPSIKLNLGAAHSQYGVDYGGEVEAFDLSWYTPYKETVDNLISGFLWVFFLWSLFRHAPGIISGAGLTHNRLDDIDSGHKKSK